MKFILDDYQSTGINHSFSNCLNVATLMEDPVGKTTSTKIPFASQPSRTRTILCALPINCANFTGETIFVRMAAILRGGWPNPSSSHSTTTTSFTSWHKQHEIFLALIIILVSRLNINELLFRQHGIVAILFKVTVWFDVRGWISYNLLVFPAYGNWHSLGEAVFCSSRSERVWFSQGSSFVSANRASRPIRPKPSVLEGKRAPYFGAMEVDIDTPPHLLPNPNHWRWIKQLIPRYVMSLHLQLC